MHFWHHILSSLLSVDLALELASNWHVAEAMRNLGPVEDLNPFCPKTTLITFIRVLFYTLSVCSMPRYSWLIYEKTLAEVWRNISLNSLMTWPRANASFSFYYKTNNTLMIYISKILL